MTLRSGVPRSDIARRHAIALTLQPRIVQILNVRFPALPTGVGILLCATAIRQSWR